ncbi:MAG: hypothetical protein KatS3mg087_2165 [Patescibacteria group bacterium]|nr:MAG: hypothetical protein KatS3mg087_2165 [Patescibacteria group bacterium]
MRNVFVGDSVVLQCDDSLGLQRAPQRHQAQPLRPRRVTRTEGVVGSSEWLGG